MNNCWKLNNADTNKNSKKGDRVDENIQPTQKMDSKKMVIEGKLSKGNSSNVSSTPRANSALVEQIIDKVRKKLLSRSGKSIVGLSRQFKIFDDNNSQTLEFEEFTKACRDFKIDLNNSEIKVVFNAFDRDQSGNIDYNEFLRNVRGEMNDFRKKLVLRAFNKLDIDKSGIVEVNDLKYVFNVKNNPDVRNGLKTEEEVYGEFIETFEMHHNIKKGSRDRRVTKEEFIEYYNNVSCSIDDDKYFEAMMTNAWKLGDDIDKNKERNIGNPLAHPHNVSREKQGAKTIQKAPFGLSTVGNPNFETTNNKLFKSKDYNANSADNILMRLRDKIAARGNRGIFGLRRTFLIHEDKDSHVLTQNKFIEVLDNYRLGLSNEEAIVLFKTFDVNKSGDIDYTEFVRGIVGEMNNLRRGLVMKAFNILDTNGNGVIEPSDLKNTYNVRRHPDVLSGKYSEEEALAEYLDNFEYHFGLLVNKLFILF